MNLIEIEITPEMLSEARAKARELGELRNSITHGEGNLAGFLGEMIAQKVLGGELKNTRDYDLLTPDGVKYDVKTKRCSGVPEPHFDCSIANFNTTQKCERYVFVRVLKDYSKGWVLGELPKDEYFKKATFIQQGQFDPRNRWRCHADCYNVAVAELNEVKQISQSGSGTEPASECCQTTAECRPSC